MANNETPTTKRPRRKKGTGSITERKNGFEASIQIGKKDNGKPRRFSKLWPTEEQAEIFLKRIREQYANPAKMARTVAYYLDRRMETKASCKPDTIEKAVSESRLIRERLGSIRVADLTVEDVRSFWSDINLIRVQDGVVNPVAGEPLSDRAKGKLREHLRGLLDLAVSDGVVKDNVARAVITPNGGGKPTQVMEVRSPQPKRKALEPDRVRRLLEVAAGHRLYALFFVALSTGLRPCELYALHWDDIDIAGGKLSVRRKLVKKGWTEVPYGPPKTDHSNRTIPISEKTLEVLLEHRERQKEEKRILGADYKNRALVFTNTEGGHLDGSKVNKALKALAERVSEPGQELPTMKWLRTSHASLGARAGLSIEVISRRLGHARVEYTFTHYRHLFADEGDRGVYAIDEMLALGDRHLPCASGGQTSDVETAFKRALAAVIPGGSDVVDALCESPRAVLAAFGSELGLDVDSLKARLISTPAPVGERNAKTA